MKLKIFDETQNFENFKFSNKTRNDTDNCSHYVEISSEDFKLIKAKKYNVEFKYDKEKILFNNKFEISHNDLSIESSKIFVKNKTEVDVLDIKSGETIEILIQGTDQNGNKVSYNEIIEKMKLKIGELEEKDYQKSIISDDEFIHIFLSITKPSLYKFDILIDNKTFNTKKILTKINVINSDCENGNVEINKKNIFIGEYGSIKISCRDKYNNTVSSIKEYENNFKLNIIGKNSLIQRSGIIPYTKTSINDILTSNFLVLFKGEYEISTYLNGNEFGSKINFSVIDEKCPEETPIMCYLRNCVKNVNQCSELIADNCSKDKPFFCWVKGTKQCVDSLDSCTCKPEYEYCKGQCINKNQTNLCLNPPMVDCSNIEGTEPCFDGTCKPKGMCGNDIACPLGYKLCAAKCIQKDLDCKFEQKKCDKITCWDFSCQNKYENCPTRKVCKDPVDYICPDGTCVKKREYCPQPPVCPKSFEYLCPDFSCRKSENDCNLSLVCLPGLALCSDNSCSKDCSSNDKCQNSKGKYLCRSGECVENQNLCPSQITCKKDKIRCNNGACVNSVEECKFNFAENKVSCPIEKPILCSDLTCVDEFSKCDFSLTNKEYCPNNSPYKCPNNECRRRLEECPTQISCPQEFPTLCPDGTCQKATYNCENRKYIEKSDVKKNKFLCSNGIYVDSINLCPTQVTCNKGMVKCWNGSCVSSLTNCIQPKNIQCQNPLFPFRCHDGECRQKFEDCPTASICPISKPIKCLDGSCRESIDLCPIIKECPNNYVSCPDGTCAPPNKCSTLITCQPFKPFMCPNKKCVNDLRLCSDLKECKGFICPDGECVNNRLDCMNIAPCSSNNPVRCDRGMCVDKIESCSNEFKCPVGYIECKSGECKTNEDLCSQEECPVNTPYRCNNGECRMNADQCDTQGGCPSSLKTKCKLGTCKIDKNQCNVLEKSFMLKLNITDIDSKFCPDGTEKMKDVFCPNENGCFSEKPIRCADGLCVSSPKECYRPKCRYNKPFQCPDGNCVIQATDCNLTSDYKNNYETCKQIGLDGYYMCADGICVSSPEYCRPIFDCPEGLSKCADGTCRSSGFCAFIAESCPESRKEKCNDGRCNLTKDSCNSLDLCPKDKVLCKDKSCAVDLLSCKDSDLDNSRTCILDAQTQKLGYRCLDGRCMEEKNKCFSVNPSCSIESPILCPDGTCKAEYSLCKSVGCESKDMIQCPNKICVNKEKYLVSCMNEIGCPLIKPHRCYDGTCVQKLEDCPISVKCPPSKPFVCSDFRCVQNKSFCNKNVDCPNFKCPKNGLCSNSEKECDNFNKYCPILSPIKCPNGLCVSEITDCQESYLIEECKEGEFFCSLKAKCLKNKSDCIGLESIKGEKTSTNRILQNDLVIENNCLNDLPFSCFDGTCRSKKEDCPLPNSCLPGEIRCPDSKCVKDKNKCISEKDKFECLVGFKKCNDGICRKNCQGFNGCPLENPYQCFNGRCVKNQIECMGYSMCQNGYYRCFNGECQKNPEDCEDIKRLYSPSKHSLTYSAYNKLELDLVLDKNKRSIASLYLPANVISSNYTKNGNQYFEIKIEEVNQSYLRNLDYNYDQLNDFQYIIAKTIKDSDGDLNYENSVLSTIVKITCPDCGEKLKHPGILKLEHNQYNNINLSHENYCLAKLENDKWRCFDTIIDDKNSKCNSEKKENEILCGSRKKKNEQNTFAIDSFGIYAVVLIPINKEEKKIFGKNIFFENLELVILSFIISSLVIFILYHVFVRILRYRTKYLDNKKKIQFKKEAVSDMMNIKLEFPGATVGDITEKIQFIPNPAFKFTGVNKDPIKQKEEEIDRMSTKAIQIDKINSELILEIEKIRDEYNEIRRMVEKAKGN
jgi:hypothetical protein